MKDLNNKKIALVRNGEGVEKAISFITSESVEKVFIEQKLKYKVFDLSPHFVSELQSYKPDLVFLATHGTFGEEGAPQGLFECLKIPYTGSGILSSALCMDKIHFKKWIHAHGIPSAQCLFIQCNRDKIYLNDTNDFQSSNLLHTSSLKQEYSIDELKNQISFPVVVKPSRSGSSLGVFICHDASSFSKSIKEAQRVDSQILIEQFIEGKEVAVSWFRGEVLTPVEIQLEEGHFYDYERKYKSPNTKYIVPAQLDVDVINQLKKITQRICEISQVYSYARVDFIVDNQNNIFTLENNTLPGLTSRSLLPKSAAHHGISYQDVVLSILKDATLHIKS